MEHITTRIKLWLYFIFKDTIILICDLIVDLINDTELANSFMNPYYVFNNKPSTRESPILIQCTFLWMLSFLKEPWISFSYNAPDGPSRDRRPKRFVAGRFNKQRFFLGCSINRTKFNIVPYHNGGKLLMVNLLCWSMPCLGHIYSKIEFVIHSLLLFGKTTLCPLKSL